MTLDAASILDGVGARVAEVKLSVAYCRLAALRGDRHAADTHARNALRVLTAIEVGLPTREIGRQQHLLRDVPGG